MQRFADGEAAQKEVKNKTYDKLAKHLRAAERRLSIDDYPALKAQRTRMEADEGVKVALERPGMEPIGERKSA